ncbi:MAG: DUF4181 domain-containing protein [Bacillus sp. (in: firmicutes)]
MPLVGLSVVILISIVMGTKVFDNYIRKWFKLEKISQGRYFTRYQMWVELLILLIFVFVANLIGIESSYTYLAILVFGIVYFGFEALVQKKYLKNSKEYKVTFLIGALKTLLFMILIVIYNVIYY